MIYPILKCILVLSSSAVGDYFKLFALVQLLYTLIQSIIKYNIKLSSISIILFKIYIKYLLIYLQKLYNIKNKFYSLYIMYINKINDCLMN